MSDGPDESTKDYLKQAWEVLSRLSDEALNAARQITELKKLDRNRGTVGLDESLINLRSCRDLLIGAIEKNSLQQLPISLQKKLFGDLEQIQESVTSLTNGTDEIVVLTDRIEVLNSDIWRFGLHNLSGQVLGYQRKLNELKHQETQILRLQDEIKETLTLRDRAERTSQEISSLLDKVKLQEVTASSAVAKVEENASNVHQFSEKASADLASIQRNSEDAARLLAAVTTSHGNVASLHSNVADAAEEIEANRKALDSLLSDSTEALEKNRNDAKELSEALNGSVARLISEGKATLSDEIQKAQSSVAQAVELVMDETTRAAESHDEALQTSLKTFESDGHVQLAAAKVAFEKLVEQATEAKDSFLAQGHADLEALIVHLKDLENQIKDKIYQATGYTLFGAFQARQNEVVKAKRGWGIATLSCVFAALALGAYVVHAIHSVQDVRFEFFAKLSLSLPIIYAIGFCSIQYTKERRLEEEYAFKASVSVSLNPYQELVAKLVTKTDELELAKYTAFVINSVENVFSSPTDKVFETHTKEGNVISERTVKQVGKLVEPLLQIATKR